MTNWWATATKAEQRRFIKQKQAFMRVKQTLIDAALMNRKITAVCRTDPGFNASQVVHWKDRPLEPYQIFIDEGAPHNGSYGRMIWQDDKVSSHNFSGTKTLNPEDALEVVRNDFMRKGIRCKHW